MIAAHDEFPNGTLAQFLLEGFGDEEIVDTPSEGKRGWKCMVDLQPGAQRSEVIDVRDV